MKILSSLLISSALLFPLASIAASTHCIAGEKNLLSAELNSKDKKTGNFRKNGKVVSICADKDTEPFSRVTYRFGKVGSVELEKTATSSSPFFVYHQMTGPRMSMATVYFHSGDITYYVSQGMGQSNGVALSVFKSGKQIAEMRSGTEIEKDYVSNLYDVDFDNIKSPVFKLKEIKDNIPEL